VASAAHAVILPVDEKAQIQAVDRTQPFVGLRGPPRATILLTP
jgi:hypothetical protein